MLRCLLLLALLSLVSCGETRRSWHGNGVLRHEGNVDLLGRCSGTWTYWYPEGELRERGTWKADHRAGTWTQWYPDGQKHSEGERVWDEEQRASPRHGRWSFWYRNGQIRGVGEFDRGRPVGEWKWWNHLGRFDTKRSGVYEDGVKVRGF
jgi:antitoxin component YwqK of YwqJK toxin-antitoxin module